MRKNTQKLRRTAAGVVVIDIQERLLPAMAEGERVVQNSVKLIQGAGVLGWRVFATEQYRKGLGPTVPQIASIIPGFTPMEKLAFSACGAEGFVPALRAAGVSDVLLCGIEAHVCVCQTCLDLLDEGFRVFVAADAISSRTAENRNLGRERMQAAGAAIVSVEMALLEGLGAAGTDDFKRMLPIIK